MKASDKTLRGLGRVGPQTSLPWLRGPKANEYKQYDAKAPKVLEGEETWTKAELQKLIAALWMGTRG